MTPAIDTIVAVSTPAGRGGIGIVRLSGTRAREIVAPFLRLRHPMEAGRARFGEVIDKTPAEPEHEPVIPHQSIIPDASASPDASVIPHPFVIPQGSASPTAVPAVLDQVVVTFFAAPNSYTSEDVVEIAAHGSPVLLEYIVRQCCAAGARLAEPGEFTQRAFLSGRIDLTQAEAVDDLIGSSTLEQARVAARQMGGALANIIAPLKATLVSLIAAMEAGIDFAEDDIDVMPASAITANIAEVRAPLLDLERSFAYGRVVRDGFKLAIVGRPNAGKSSLFNRLVERDRAIVTPTPGTTRDLVTERVAIGGIPVDLIDTAGLREGTDQAERMGIAKSHEAMADADVVLLVVDATQGMGDEDRAVLERGALLAWNKSDLEDGSSPIPLLTTSRRIGHPEIPALREDNKQDIVRTSAVTGAGLAELRAAIVAAIAGEAGGVRESGMLTNLRQHQAVTQALAGLDAARIAVESAIPHEMVMLDLYEALRGLDALTGVTTSEDVLRLIFSKFCIGK